MSLPNPVFNNVTAASATISGGTIDSTVIGGTTPASLNGLVTSTGSSTASTLAARFATIANVLDDREESRAQDHFQEMLEGRK